MAQMVVFFRSFLLFVLFPLVSLPPSAFIFIPTLYICHWSRAFIFSDRTVFFPPSPSESIITDCRISVQFAPSAPVSRFCPLLTRFSTLPRRHARASLSGPCGWPFPMGNTLSPPVRRAELEPRAGLRSGCINRSIRKYQGRIFGKTSLEISIRIYQGSGCGQAPYPPCPLAALPPARGCHSDGSGSPWGAAPLLRARAGQGVSGIFFAWSKMFQTRNNLGDNSDGMYSA